MSSAAFIGRYAPSRVPHVMTGVLHSVSSSSFRSPRHRLRSFPGCFGPSISTLMCMYFLFMHSQGGCCTCTQTLARCYVCCSGCRKDLLHRCSRPTRRSLDPSQSPLQSSTPPTGSHQKGDST